MSHDEASTSVALAPVFRTSQQRPSLLRRTNILNPSQTSVLVTVIKYMEDDDTVMIGAMRRESLFMMLTMRWIITLCMYSTKDRKNFRVEGIYE
jgi:hypothetical protein